MNAYSFTAIEEAITKKTKQKKKVKNFLSNLDLSTAF